MFAQNECAQVWIEVYNKKNEEKTTDTAYNYRTKIFFEKSFQKPIVIP